MDDRKRTPIEDKLAPRHTNVGAVVIVVFMVVGMLVIAAATFYLMLR